MQHGLESTGETDQFDVGVGVSDLNSGRHSALRAVVEVFHFAVPLPCKFDVKETYTSPERPSRVGQARYVKVTRKDGPLVLITNRITRILDD